MLLRRALLALALVVLAGCGGSKRAESTTTSGLPPGCEVPRIDQVVTQFLGAITSGDRDTLRVLVANDFRLLEVQEGRGAGERAVSVNTKAAALRYLDSRIRLHEQLRLLRLRVESADDVNHVLITFTVTRRADDFRRRHIVNRVATGDGVIDCVDGNVEGWSIQGP